MRLSQVAGELGARIVAGGERAAAMEVDGVVAASAMSELLAVARPGVLPVTDLDSTQVVRALELLDAECLGWAGAEPSAEVVDAARRAGLVVLVCSQALAGVVHTVRTLGLPCSDGGGGRR